MQAKPGTMPPTPGQPASLFETQQQRTAAARRQQSAETFLHPQQHGPGPTDSHPSAGMAELPGGTRLDAPHPGNGPAAETMQLFDHLLDDHHDVDMQPADTDETGPQAGVEVVPITVEQLFAAAKQYQSEHVPPALHEIRWAQRFVVYTSTMTAKCCNSTTPAACRLHADTRLEAVHQSG